ncbi:MAG: Cytochrome c oxidase caa3-type, assembly factor CtaG-related protein [Acidobacteriales bacterium]|nr:Cytochrome c oxidase caa3-type, assembly factor CtaG-related protein [Terriglobales bacterium]
MPHLNHIALGSCELTLTLSIIFLAVVYLRGWLHLRSPSLNAVASWRAGSFLLGLFLIWVAVASPIATLDRRMLTVHMLQHLLLMSLAPPLIWLGAPVLPLLHGLPQRLIQQVGPLFHCAPVQRLGKALADPAFCWIAAAVVLVGWHIPAALTLGLRSEGWHLVEHASFLAAGLLFWWPVVQPWPSVSRSTDFSMILYLFFATLPCDVLSGLLVFCDRVVYSVYFSASRPFGLSALEDQQCAGALMWTCVTVVYLIAGAMLTMRLLVPRDSRSDELVLEFARDAVPESDSLSLEVLR